MDIIIVNRHTVNCNNNVALCELAAIKGGTTCYNSVHDTVPSWGFVEPEATRGFLAG